MPIATPGRARCAAVVERGLAPLRINCVAERNLLANRVAKGLDIGRLKRGVGHAAVTECGSPFGVGPGGWGGQFGRSEPGCAGG